MWYLRNWFYRFTGFKSWVLPGGYQFRYWLLWAWNEYDDWLYDGIHGFRIIGAEFDTHPRWLERLCWRLLPLFRFFIRRPAKCYLCHHPSVCRCDFILEIGIENRSCDRPLCDDCRISWNKDINYCPEHAVMSKREFIIR